MKKVIYLDYAAATPLDSEVLAAMGPYFSEQFYNPSALYLGAKDVARDVAKARTRIAGQFGVRPAEVIFTAGGTEANNLAIHGVMQQFPEANVVVSTIEHESVLKPAHQYACKEAPVTKDGQVDVLQLEKLIDDQTVLVSVMYANNEIGTIQPIRKITTTLEEVRKRRKYSGNDLPLYFHTDACQAAQYLDLHVSRLGVDLMTINGGKMYGPKQSGALFVRAGVKLQPQILGGGQEFGVRSGTENVAGSIGLSVALDLAQARRHEETERLQKLQKVFITELQAAIPVIQINGSLKSRLPNNVHVTIPGTDNERLVMALDEAGIQAAAGSACSASSEEPSHVLRALGMSETDAQASLRFTMGRGTTEQDIHTTVNTLKKILKIA
ncbi:MAG TPA: cysteine desulfurase family protein [Candidatus Limnocylindria bacterium]|nr:cysteine desulfurase family protein [Candidatus Limnocylindria bacterium]